MSDTKISPYSLNDLKNTTDDALANYLRGLSFKQDNSKLDIRLAMGYAAVVIAAATFAADYKLGWEATKTWTAVAVAAYTLLNSGFTYWMWAVEKGLVFEGVKNGSKLSLASKTKKHDPTYYLTVTSTSSSPSRTSVQELATPFTTWFTADGYFVAQPFQQWLASSIGVIAQSDPKNAPNENLDHVANGNTSTAKVTGSDSAAGGSKRSKRKG